MEKEKEKTHTRSKYLLLSIGLFSFFFASCTVFPNSNWLNHLGVSEHGSSLLVRQKRSSLVCCDCRGGERGYLPSAIPYTIGLVIMDGACIRWKDANAFGDTRDYPGDPCAAVIFEAAFHLNFSELRKGCP